MPLIVAACGFALSFVGSMPVVGPIGLLVVSRGLAGRPKQARLIAMGAALAEAGYAFLAMWSVGQAVEHDASFTDMLRLVGGLVLVVVGALLAIRPPQPRLTTAAPETTGSRRSFFLGLGVSGLNPLLLVTWSAAVTALYATGYVRVERAMALPFALGVSIGIFSWFSILLKLLGRHRHRIAGGLLTRVLRVIGVVLAATGLVMTLKVLFA